MHKSVRIIGSFINKSYHRSFDDGLKKGIYRHYKGNLYQVIDVARHSETLEKLVVYRALYGNYDLWVRPLEMFLESLDIDGQSVPRFKFLKD